MRGMLDGGDLHVTPEARELAIQIVMRPPVPLRVRPLLELVNQITVGLLPRDIRRQYGLRWDPARRARAARRRGVRQARRSSRCCPTACGSRRGRGPPDSSLKGNDRAPRVVESATNPPKEEERTMRNLKLVLQKEPAAIGTLVASILPVLILLGLMPSLDDRQVAAIVVAINALVGFGIRLTVPVAPPRRRRRRAAAAAPQTTAAP